MQVLQMVILKQAYTALTQKPQWFLRTFFLCAITTVILSCAQDPIFYNIHMEAPPRKPVIAGSPQNMVIARDGVYTWTSPGRNIWVFDESTGWRWQKLSSTPSGSIRGLAAFGDSESGDLFAIVTSGGHIPEVSQVWRYDTNSQWGKLHETTDFVLHRLFAAGGTLFIGGQRNGNEYTILSLDTNTSSVETILTGSSDMYLAGAVKASNGTILLATGKNGIFNVTSGTPEPFAPASSFTINGMITTGDNIVVIGNSTSRGILHVLKADSAYSEWQSSALEQPDLLFNGGMGVWKHNTETGWQPSLLLLGIRSNGSTLNGYRELALNEDGSVNSSYVLNRPGQSGFVSSVVSQDRYREGIETRSVHYILQVPNLGGNFYPANNNKWQPPIFAGTAQHGLFAYDFRNDRWSADDNSVAWEQ